MTSQPLEHGRLGRAPCRRTGAPGRRTRRRSSSVPSSRLRAGASAARLAAGAACDEPAAAGVATGDAASVRSTMTPGRYSLATTSRPVRVHDLVPAGPSPRWGSCPSRPGMLTAPRRSRSRRLELDLEGPPDVPPWSCRSAAGSATDRAPRTPRPAGAPASRSSGPGSRRTRASRPSGLTTSSAGRAASSAPSGRRSCRRCRC